MCPGLTSFPLPLSTALLDGLDTLILSAGANILPALTLVARTGGGDTNVNGNTGIAASLDGSARHLAATATSLRDQCSALAVAAGPYWRAAAAAIATPVPVGGLTIHKGQASIWGLVGSISLLVLVLGCVAMRTPPAEEQTAEVSDAVTTTGSGSEASKSAPATASTVAGSTDRGDPQVRSGLRQRISASVGGRLRRVFMTVDRFALQHKVERRQSPLREPTPLGGMCSLWGILTLIGFAAVLILQRAEDNTSRTVAVDTGGDLQLMLARAATRSASNSEGSLAGIHTLVAVVGEPGACASLVSWRASGLYSGSFSHSVRTCGSLAMHFFMCPDCVVTVGSALSVVLPWSCQAMLLRGVAVGTDGVVSSRNATAFAPIPQAQSAPVASPDGSDDGFNVGLDGDNTVDEDAASVTLLSMIEASLTPVLLLQNDTTGEDGKEALARGYRLLGGHVTRKDQTYTADSFTPATAAVHLTVNLEPSGFY